MRLALWLLLLLALPARAADFAAPPLAVGSSWYPEQWPEAQWDSDLAAMRKAGLRVVRVGEFAWARMEPEDGRFDFGWLDRAIAAAARHGLKLVLGTPTAAPPIWLQEAHPDILRIGPDGRADAHGTRRQFSVASATYRRYATRIAAEMAKRYGHDPRVAGWQIDNEIGLPSFDPEARAQWAQWLAARYGDIESLNRRWTTDYWSQRYQRFDQVPLSLDPEQSPALLLDVKRFMSDLWAGYVGDQARAIRAVSDRRQFITTNSTAWNDHFDQYRVHRMLDMAAWDDYVPDGRPDWDANALHHDVVRGYLRRNFWVMETQPGTVNWGRLNRSLDPGQTREMAWQAVAHGADAVLYWQWRSALNGQEQYHGTLVGPDGEPMPVLPEIARTAAEMHRIGPLLAGTTPVSRVAILYAQESRWAIEQQRFHAGYDPVAVMKSWYRPFARAGQPVDVLPPDADFSGHALIVAPALNLIDSATAKRLLDWVRAGGHLVLGPRSGMKDGDNALWPMRQPGPLAAPLDARVEEYYALDGPVRLQGGGAADIWAERLSAGPRATVGLRYAEGGWLAGAPATVETRVGRGLIRYVGMLADADTQAMLTRSWLETAGIAPVASPGPAVEIALREGGGRRYVFVINHGDTPVAQPLPPGMTAVMGDGRTIAAHDVAIFREDMR